MPTLVNACLHDVCLFPVPVLVLALLHLVHRAIRRGCLIVQRTREDVVHHLARLRSLYLRREDLVVVEGGSRLVVRAVVVENAFFEDKHRDLRVLRSKGIVPRRLISYNTVDIEMLFVVNGRSSRCVLSSHHSIQKKILSLCPLISLDKFVCSNCTLLIFSMTVLVMLLIRMNYLHHPLLPVKPQFLLWTLSHTALQ